MRKEEQNEHNSATFVVRLAGADVINQKYDTEEFEKSANEHVKKNLASLADFKAKYIQN